jgi:hypothetical protein
MRKGEAEFRITCFLAVAIDINGNRGHRRKKTQLG